MPSDNERALLQQGVLTATAYFLHLIGIAATLYQQANYWQQPYHTSALSGAAWVNKLIHGHPDHIFNELGMQLHVFMSFCAHLQLICGITTSQNGVTVEEQAAIFLDACVTGLSVQHLRERFQHSNETISMCVCLFLHNLQPYIKFTWELDTSRKFLMLSVRAISTTTLSNSLIQHQSLTISTRTPSSSLFLQMLWELLMELISTHGQQLPIDMETRIGKAESHRTAWQSVHSNFDSFTLFVDLKGLLQMPQCSCMLT